MANTPGADVLHCSYCGHDQRLAQPARPVREHPYDDPYGHPYEHPYGHPYGHPYEHPYDATPPAPRVPAEQAGTHRYACRQCGARVQGDAVSQRCRFCTAPLVIDTTSDHQVAPEAVLPFALDRAAAKARLHTWMESHSLEPGRLRNPAETEPLTSVFLPYWTFDARTVTHYTGRRGEHYWSVETHTQYVNGSAQTTSREVKKTRWHPVSGSVARDFDDVLVTATRRVAADKLSKLMPWPLADAVPFSSGHVAGHESLRYDIEPDEGLSQAKYTMTRIVTADCRQDIGADDQRVDSLDITHEDVTYKLVLLPVWAGSYLYGGRPWQVLVNGRTGQVHGDPPPGQGSVAIKALVALALVVAVVAVITLVR